MQGGSLILVYLRTVIIKADDLEFTSNTFNLNAGSGKLILENTTPKLQMTTTDAKILLGSATTVDLGEGIFMDGAGNFRMGDATSGGTDYLKFTSSGDLVIKSSDIDITASSFNLTSTFLRITDALVATALANGIVISGASKHILVGSGITIAGAGAGSIAVGSLVDLQGTGTSTIAGWQLDTGILKDSNNKSR